MSGFELTRHNHYCPLKYFREKRQRENLSQRELLKKELIQIAWVIVAIILIMGSLIALAFWILR